MFQFPLWKISKFKTAIILVAAVSMLMIAASPQPQADWTSAGQGRTNWRYQPLESTISSQNAATLSI